MTITRKDGALLLQGSFSIEDAWELRQALIDLKTKAGPSLDLRHLEGIDLSIAQLLLCFVREVADISIDPPVQEDLRSILRTLGVLKC